MEQQVFSAKETSRVLGYSLSTFRRRIRKGHFPKGVNLSKGRVGWFRSDIEDELKKLKSLRIPAEQQLAYTSTWRTDGERNV